MRHLRWARTLPLFILGSLLGCDGDGVEFLLLRLTVPDEQYAVESSMMAVLVNEESSTSSVWYDRCLLSVEQESDGQWHRRGPAWLGACGEVLLRPGESESVEVSVTRQAFPVPGVYRLSWDLSGEGGLETVNSEPFVVID